MFLIWSCHTDLCVFCTVLLLLFVLSLIKDTLHLSKSLIECKLSIQFVFELLISFCALFLLRKFSLELQWEKLEDQFDFSNLLFWVSFYFVLAKDVVEFKVIEYLSVWASDQQSVLCSLFKIFSIKILNEKPEDQLSFFF